MILREDKQAQLREKNAKQVRKIIQNAIELEFAHKKKHLQDMQEKETPEYQRAKREREIRQKLDVTKRNVCEALVGATEEMNSQIVEFIKTNLNLFKRLWGRLSYREDISFEQIQEVVDLCMPAFDKLKRVSEYEDVHVRSKHRFYTEYERLFNELIDYDVRFAYFAPNQSFDRNVVRNKLLEANDEIKGKMKERELKFKKDTNSDYFNENIDKRNVNNINSEVKEIIEKEKAVEFKARYDIVCATESLASDLYSFILDDLKLNDIDTKSLKYKDINATLDFCKLSLKLLASLSFDKELNNVSGWDIFDPYTELFNRLIDINIKFAIFAPKTSLNRFDIDFEKMSEKERGVMLTVLKRNGLWDDPEYVEVYQPLFNSSTNLNV